MGCVGGGNPVIARVYGYGEAASEKFSNNDELNLEIGILLAPPRWKARVEPTTRRIFQMNKKPMKVLGVEIGRASCRERV